MEEEKSERDNNAWRKQLLFRCSSASGEQILILVLYYKHWTSEEGLPKKRVILRSYKDLLFFWQIFHPTWSEGRSPIRIQWAGINMIHKRDAHPLCRGAKVKKTDRKDPIPHSPWMAFMDFCLFSGSLAVQLFWSLSIVEKLLSYTFGRSV
ncbi:hypothetical protein JTE90_021852 [Oedothorax gibbosus]|uniref:Uncharacterized protein n=1 Tax=Oedothorax gibbosus TaxID=931172 RepID=A0AAV6V063_9ARAC|nr:hypothetical protein JTE90_021852 [Oedothorax gibbosus]